MDRILIIEDDMLVAELERDYLEANDFQVEIAADANKGLKEVLAGGYDALILGTMLPGKNGFDICREVRTTLNIPILMITGKKDEVDKIRGLGVGADDVIAKPFSPSELVARVRSHIKIHEMLLNHKAKEDDKGIRLERLAIYPKERKVTLDEQDITLANKEFELLLFLAENPNIVFSKDLLFERIWGWDSEGNTATVTVHINRLRDKLENDTSNPKYIQTVWGAGYRLRSA